MEIKDVIYFDKERVNLAKTSDGIEVLDEEYRPVELSKHAQPEEQRERM